MENKDIKPVKHAKLFDSNKPFRDLDQMVLDLSMTYIHVTRIIYDSKIEDWRSPFIVNATLAIELYLKSMQSRSKKFAPGPKTSDTTREMVQIESKILFKGNGHNLFNLYLQIPERNRDFLEKIFSQPGHDIDFKNFLKDHSKKFITWRYCYEGKTEPFSAEKVLKVLKILEGYRLSLHNLDRVIPHYEV